jgi:3-carboxy-cis,cis-muconate cycloisomerase
MYGTAKLRRIFSDENMVQCWLDYEAALARAEAAVGLIPAEAAAEITEQARAENMDFAALKTGIDQSTHELVPLVWQLASICKGEAGRWVHWGATTQDVTDTGLVLQIKAARALLLADLQALAASLAGLARRERDTLMAGRTHGQHALPITFGYKVAIWLAEIRRHSARLHDCGPRVLVGQFAGAAGTLAAVGAKGPEIQRLLMADLGLGVPDIAWHAARDGLAEWGTVMALLAATLGKIAHEIILLQKSEVAETEEPYQRGKVGSSTMPHKRNPMLCEGIVAEARLVRNLVPSLLTAMEAEHERDWASMHIEWAVIPEITLLAGGALAQTRRAIDGLIIYRDKMAANVDILHGLILSEAVMLQLAEHVGRQTAHEVVHEAAMLAFEQRRPLAELLAADPRLSAHFSVAQLAAMLDPAAYTGLAAWFVDRVAGTASE